LFSFFSHSLFPHYAYNGWYFKETLSLDDTRGTSSSKNKHKPIIASPAAKTDCFNQRYRFLLRDGR
ncbi:MAG: hypothetical protein O3C49_10160, partial [Proteobacteria bacterium]|nr:hypothetical protein [Pseudomonadota bacterium]